MSDIVAFRLNHNCSKPGCVGDVGDVILVTEEHAVFLETNRGGSRVPDHDPQSPNYEAAMEKKRKAKEAKRETATAKHNAETR